MIVPSARFVRACAAWTAAALLSLPLPWLAPLLWGALALLLALVAIDALALYRGDMPEAVRRLPTRALVGRQAEVAIDLSASSARPLRVDLTDEVPGELRDEEPRFVDLWLPAGRTTSVRYPIVPRRRGNFACGRLLLLVDAPLGLLRRRRITASSDVVQVFPDTSQLVRPDRLEPHSAPVRSGIKPVLRRGEGTELESLREYVPGDDPRRIYWAASARRGRLVVRVNQHERNHSVILALDRSRLMGTRIGERSKLDYAIDATLALAYAALIHGDRIGLVVFDREVVAYLPPRQARRQFGRFLEVLQPLTTTSVEPSYRRLVRTLSIRHRQRAVVILLTDFVDNDHESTLLPLTILANQHRLLVSTLRDPLFTELEPQAEEPARIGRMYRRLVLHDLATARELALAELRRGGVQTVDLEPQRIVEAVVNRYLAIRYGPDR